MIGDGGVRELVTAIARFTAATTDQALIEKRVMSVKMGRPMMGKRCRRQENEAKGRDRGRDGEREREEKERESERERERERETQKILPPGCFC